MKTRKLRNLILATGAITLAMVATLATAKLPAPSDEAKAKAAEAAAKTAHGNKVADFQLCKSADRVAASYLASAKQAGKTLQPTVTPPCADPGPFVYAPPPAVAASAAAGVKPIEAAGARAPTATAAAAPGTMAPAAAVQPPKK